MGPTPCRKARGTYSVSVPGGSGNPIWDLCQEGKRLGKVHAAGSASGSVRGGS